MYDDYKNFGWQYIKEIHMPDGIIPRWFEYLKALDRLVNKLAKEQYEEKKFEHQVHQTTNPHVPRPGSRVTRIREVQLPKGAEGETFW